MKLPGKNLIIFFKFEKQGAATWVLPTIINNL